MIETLPSTGCCLEVPTKKRENLASWISKVVACWLGGGGWNAHDHVGWVVLNGINAHVGWLEWLAEVRVKIRVLARFKPKN